jgi:hypothetical protein
MADGRRPSDDNRDDAQSAEVICVVRGASASGKNEVIVLDRVSTAFLEQLAAEREAQERR